MGQLRHTRILQGKVSPIFQAEAILPVHIIVVVLNLHHLTDDASHVSAFGGENAGVVELDVVPEFDAVLYHECFVWMFQPDLLTVFLQPGIDQMVSLASICYWFTVFFEGANGN
jgi:hypothetical protein